MFKNKERLLINGAAVVIFLATSWLIVVGILMLIAWFFGLTWLTLKVATGIYFVFVLLKLVFGGKG